MTDIKTCKICGETFTGDHAKKQLKSHKENVHSIAFSEDTPYYIQ